MPTPDEFMEGFFFALVYTVLILLLSALAVALVVVIAFAFARLAETWGLFQSLFALVVLFVGIGFAWCKTNKY